MADPLTMPTLLRAWPVVPAIHRPDLSLQIEQSLGIAKLHIHGADAGTRFLAIAGSVPPPIGKQTEQLELGFAWLAPGEWLVTGREPDVTAWEALTEERGGDEALVVDLTHALTAFKLSGAGARTALAAHCPLDLGREAFPVDAVARSLLGEVRAFVARLADGPGGPQFRIIVDQTMSAYVARMLAGA